MIGFMACQLLFDYLMLNENIFSNNYIVPSDWL